MNSILWWRFWEPQSGAIGGVIFGTVVAISALISALILAPPIIFVSKIWWSWWLG